MDELFELFKKLVALRLQFHGSFKAFGEDSIRYDFYYALQQQYKLSPHEIILEQAIPPSQFEHKERDLEELAQGRHEDKPEFDLRVDPTDSLSNGILAEFAFFRTPPIGKVDATGSHGKILNEIHRLSLLKHFTNSQNNSMYKDFSDYKCLLICVTDDVMINYGTAGKRGPRPVPIQKKYRMDEVFLSKLTETTKGKIQSRFKNRAAQLDIIPTAQRFKDLMTIAQGNLPKWAIWVWEVDFEENHSVVGDQTK